MLCFTRYYSFPGTIAEGAPVVPISAQLKYNIEVICEYVCRKIPIPLRDFTSQPRLIGKGNWVGQDTTILTISWLN